MKKTKIIISSLAIGVMSLFTTLTYAQAPTNMSNISEPTRLSPEELKKAFEQANKNTIVLADVTVGNAKVVSSEKNNFTIAFTITNNQGIQTGVKYAVQLVKNEKDNPIVYDRKVFDEELVLGEKETVPKVVNYEAPNFASGDFEIWITSTQDNGLPLGQIKVEDVKLDGTGEYINMQNCYLTVEGENSGTKYTLLQGVDVSKDENLILNCQAKNNFNHQVSAILNFETRYRTGLGKVVSEKKSDSISFGSNEEKKIALPISKENSPQAYDVAFMLKDEQGKIISNDIYFHYVIRGLSGTIQNVRLNKNNYTAGETAIVKLALSSSADNFVGARNTEGTKYDKAIIELTMTDASGNLCADKIKKEINPDSANQIVEMPVKINCLNSPKVSVAMKDSNGNVLDSFSTVFGKAKEDQGEKEAQPGLPIPVIIIFSLTILSIILAIFLHWRKSRNLSNFRMFIFFTFLSLGIFYSTNAHAVTFATPTAPSGQYAAFEANLNSPVYRIDQSIIARGQSSVVGCANMHTTWIYGWVGPEEGYVVIPYWGYGSTGARSFGPIRNPGRYTATFLGRDEALLGAFGQYYSDATATIDFDVAPPPLAGNEISANPPAITNGQGTTVSWTSWNAAYCALWGGTWNDTPVGVNSPGSSWTGALSSGAGYIDFTIGCHNGFIWTWDATRVTISNPCIPDSSCLSHAVTWGSCSATACGTSGTIPGTCDDGCGGTGYATPLACSAPACCVPDTNCTSHAITWGSCTGSCGTTGTRAGTCDNGCGGIGSTSGTCPTLPCCLCNPSEEASRCSTEKWNDSCGNINICSGKKDCTDKDWKEVAPH